MCVDNHDDNDNQDNNDDHDEYVQCLVYNVHMNICIFMLHMATATCNDDYRLTTTIIIVTIALLRLPTTITACQIRYYDNYTVGSHNTIDNDDSRVTTQLQQSNYYDCRITTSSARQIMPDVQTVMILAVFITNHSQLFFLIPKLSTN